MPKRLKGPELTRRLIEDYHDSLMCEEDARQALPRIVPPRRIFSAKVPEGAPTLEQVQYLQNCSELLSIFEDYQRPWLSKLYRDEIIDFMEKVHAAPASILQTEFWREAQRQLNKWHLASQKAYNIDEFFNILQGYKKDYPLAFKYFQDEQERLIQHIKDDPTYLGRVSLKKIEETLKGKQNQLEQDQVRKKLKSAYPLAYKYFSSQLDQLLQSLGGDTVRPMHILGIERRMQLREKREQYEQQLALREKRALKFEILGVDPFHGIDTLGLAFMAFNQEVVLQRSLLLGFLKGLAVERQLVHYGEPTFDRDKIEIYVSSVLRKLHEFEALYPQAFGENLKKFELLKQCTQMNTVIAEQVLAQLKEIERRLKKRQEYLEFLRASKPPEPGSKEDATAKVKKHRTSKARDESYRPHHARNKRRNSRKKTCTKGDMADWLDYLAGEMDALSLSSEGDDMQLPPPPPQCYAFKLAFEQAVQGLEHNGRRPRL